MLITQHVRLGRGHMPRRLRPTAGTGRGPRAQTTHQGERVTWDCLWVTMDTQFVAWDLLTQCPTLVWPQWVTSMSSEGNTREEKLRGRLEFHRLYISWHVSYFSIACSFGPYPTALSPAWRHAPTINTITVRSVISLVLTTTSNLCLLSLCPNKEGGKHNVVTHQGYFKNAMCCYILFGKKWGRG